MSLPRFGPPESPSPFGSEPRTGSNGRILAGPMKDRPSSSSESSESASLCFDFRSFLFFRFFFFFAFGGRVHTFLLRFWSIESSLSPFLPFLLFFFLRFFFSGQLHPSR